MSKGLNPNPTVEVFYTAKADLGEGPFFEPETNQLLWVDIEEHTINFLNVETVQNRSIKLPDTVGAVIPLQDSSNLLASVGRKLCIVDRESGGVVEELDTVEEDRPQNRFNDAKCDVNGRLWAGTMSKLGFKEPERGNLYTWSSGKLSQVLTMISISNGLAWSLDNKTMYYIDSIPKHVYSFDYNLENGTIDKKQVCIDFEKHGEDFGVPDGMCTDIEGRLWIASFHGGRVSCFDPKTGGLLLSVKIPNAMNITSCCFGGPDHSWLFITSAGRHGVSDPSSQPNGGNIFVIKDSGTRGQPGSRLKHNS